MGKLTRIQKKILDLMLDRYESSKSYIGENKVKQTFRVRPSEVFAEYLDDFTDVTEVEQFEREVEILSEEKLVSIYRGKQGEIRDIQAADDRIPEYYVLLNRRQRREEDLEERQMYEMYALRDDVLGTFCRDQLSLLEKGRSAKYRMDRARNYLALLDRILGNSSETYERELSVEVLHDSKLFEKSYRKTLCGILREYGDYEEIIGSESEERNIQELILESHQIYANPGYVFVKGKAVFYFRDGSTMELKKDMPLGLSSSYLNEVIKIEVKDIRALTIENLTAFHRFDEDGFFCIYLSGYHSHRITDFLRKIADPEHIRWFHFGDPDPDGFYILRNLRLKSGLKFSPYHMEAELLQKYEKYGKKLTENDRVKAEKLIELGFYPDVQKEMLKRDIKLEQEVLCQSVFSEKLLS